MGKFIRWHGGGRTPTVEESKDPDYELSQAEKEGRGDMDETFHASPDNSLTYSPTDKQRIPAEGAWVMITRRLPALEGNVDANIRVGRFFWVERENGADKHGFLKNGTFKVRLRSPWGELSLWPYEYAMVPPEEITSMWQDGEIIFHPMNIDDARMNDITFYARTRGISLASAAVMALGTLSGPVGWFEPIAEIAEEAEAMEEHVHRWKKHPRIKEQENG